MVREESYSKAGPEQTDPRGKEANKTGQQKVVKRSPSVNTVAATKGRTIFWAF